MAKKVLITGGAGFIGKELVNQLTQKGYKVLVADDLSKFGPKSKPDCDFIKIDLTNKNATLKIFRGIDYCIHLASKIGGIGYIHKHPATILSENNKIHSSVFEAAYVNGIKRIVYVSSSMVFESTKSYPSLEKDLVSIPPPTSAYGFSKLTGEKYCQAFYEEFGLEYVICRPFNAYGINEMPGEEVGYAHVIPDLIKKVFSGQYPLEILGDGTQTRSFTHVSDIARGIILAMENKNAANQDFNLGTEKETRIIDLAKTIFNLCFAKKEFKVKFIPGFKYDIQKRLPSSKKAAKILSWKTEKKLKQELPEIIEWINKNRKRR